MAVLDKKYNLTDRSWELNHGETFIHPHAHWLMHLGQYVKSISGVDSKKYKEYIKKIADELPHMETITIDELNHYRTHHEEEYLESLKTYIDWEDVPKGETNFVLEAPWMPNSSALPFLISNDLNRIKERVGK